MQVFYKSLFMALKVKRQHGGIGEAKFVADFINLMMGEGVMPTMIDGQGNVHFDRRSSLQGTSKTLFTAHTDTVHREEGQNHLVDSSEEGFRKLSAINSPLGADDGAGVAVLAHMMCHHVPGYYTLFRGEECGGVGSSWLAENMPELLAEFDRAVAFDRAGYGDVITHQAGGRCASDEFGQALADSLNRVNLDFMFSPDPTGVYTDTAEFVGIIPECTNLSVGYFQQHSEREWLNVTFLENLAKACCDVEWETLPVKREAGTTADQYTRVYLETAILDTLEGYPNGLLEILESETLGAFIDEKYLTKEVLEVALCMSKVNLDDALDYLLDKVYWDVLEEDDSQSIVPN